MLLSKQRLNFFVKVQQKIWGNFYKLVCIFNNMDEKILVGIIIGIVIVVVVVLMLYFNLITNQMTITNIPNPVVATGSTQYLYNIQTPTRILSISVSFSMTPVPNSTPPADGIQIILGSNNVNFTGGIYQCRIQGNCPPGSGVGAPITFNGIMAGFELYYNTSNPAEAGAPYLFICTSNRQCFTTSIPQINQPISGTLTVNVSSSGTQASLQLSDGSLYTVTAPLSIKTNVAEVSVTTGNNYAIWNLYSIKVKYAII